MKLSNNAIKFLMAQYRAIYKNAYVKGLATAVILTSALAAGQAHAANLAADLGNISTAGPLDIDTSTATFTSTPDQASYTWNADVLSKSNSGGANSITSNKAGGVTLTGTGSLTLNHTTTPTEIFKFAGAASDKSLTVNIGKIDVKAGVLDIASDAAGAVKVGAKTIDIGGTEGKAAKVTFNKGSTFGIDLAKANQSTLSTITLKKDGSIETGTPAGTETNTINAAVFNVTGGTLKLNAASADHATKNIAVTLNIASGSMSEGVFDVGKNDTLTVSFTDHEIGKSGSTTENLEKVFEIKKGDIKLAADSKLVFSGAATANGVVKIDAANTTFSTAEGALIVSGNAGLLTTVDNLNTLAGKIATTISGGALDLGEDDLDLTSSENKLNIGATGSKGGSVGFGADSTLRTTGTVTIAKDLVNNQANTIEAGKVALNSADGDKFKKSIIVANNSLDLKSNANFSGSNAKINLGTQSFNTITKSADYVAIEKQNLSNAEKNEKRKIMLLQHSGTISSTAGKALTLSEGAVLNIENGSWNADTKITLGGSAAASKLNIGDHTSGAALLSFGTGGALDVTSGDIVVGSGSVGTPYYAELDLTSLADDNLNLAKGTLKAGVNGLIKAKAGQLSKLVSTNFGTTISSGGTLALTGDAVLDQSKIATTASANKLAFTGGASNLATLKADTLTITAANNTASAAAVDIGASGAILAGTLTLINEVDNTQKDFQLDSGNFTVLSNLSADGTSGLKLTLGKEQTVLQLGNLVADGQNAFKIDPEASPSGNTVEYDVDVTANAKLNVHSGQWEIGNLTLTSGAATIGKDSSGSPVKDSDGNIIGSSVKGNKLNISTNGTFKVVEGSEASFKEFTQAGTTTTINGKMHVDGKYYEHIADDQTTAGTNEYQKERFGLDITGTVAVSGSDAVLSLGNAGLQYITGFKEQDIAGNKETVVTTKESDETSGTYLDAISGSGKITLTDFATLKLDLSHLKNNQFTASELSAIRKEFTGLDKAENNQGFIELVGGSLSGAGVTADNTIDIKDLTKFNDFKDIKVDNLMNAQVTGIDQNNNPVISQNVGSLKADGTTTASIGQATLNKALPLTSGGEAHFAVNTDGKDLKLNVKGGGYLHLNNGGTAGEVKLATTTSGKTQLLVSGGQTQTVIDKVSGADNSYMELVSGVTKINKGLTVSSMNTAAGTELTFGDFANGFTLTDENSVSEFEGNVNVNTGLTNISGTAVFAGQKNFFKNNANLGTEASFLNGETVFDSVLNAKKAEDGVYIQKNAVVTVEKGVVLGANTHFVVGADNEYAADGKTVVESGSTGYLNAKYFKLNGGVLMVDPEYGMKTSVAAVGAFAEAGHWLSKDVTEANLGTIDGKVILGKNSALGVEKDINVAGVQNFISTYQDANGSLSEDGVSNVLYLNGKVTVAAGGQIVLDGHTPSETLFSNVENNKYGYKKDEATPLVASDLYLGTGSVLALDNRAVNGAVHFNKDSATIYAPEGEKDSQMGKIVLAGDQFLNSRNITLFTAGTTAEGTKASNVEVLGASGGKGIRVESINGLMYFTLNVGKLDDNGYTLKLDKERVATAFTAASEPMRDFLIGYTAQDKNWYDVANAVDGAKTEVLLGEVANPMISADKGTIAYSADATEEFKQANPLSNFVAVNTGTAEAPQYVAYEKAYNGFLEDVVRNTNGADADRVGRMAAFG
ncbi:hypothetical protein, partial [Anaerobiospirillum sp. NML120449]|uniref:beta strand repeat-containing protein n=1 Tax=Anaerobiospirillum sp. NML120449 TaxID=2932817 RepID=UPI001FF63E12